MIIFGIDPGFAITGYGVIEKIGNKYKVLEYGAITTEAKLDFNTRLSIIYKEINEKFEEFKPDCVAMEELFFCKNITTGINVAQARGVMLLAITQLGKPFFEYTPLQVKQAITGFGKADKKQMQKMVQVLLNLDSIPKPDDAADALAIALCCGNTERNIGR
jgi:crossover junction endodeoxyribonuclease RuvC